MSSTDIFNASICPIGMSQAHHKTTTAAPESSAQMAHELANLLDASMRHVGLALASLKEPDPNQGATAPPADDEIIHRLETASQGLKRMARLLNQWLAPRSLRPGLADPSPAVDLKTALEQAILLMRPLLAANRIALHLSIDPAAGRLPAPVLDPILINALRNSIEALAGHTGTPAGRIAVDLTLVGTMVRLQISDNGPGLDPAVLDAGGRAVPGRTSKPGGHGLGLTVCQKIAQSLGGTFTLRNLQPHGAELTLSWPVAPINPATD